MMKIFTRFLLLFVGFIAGVNLALAQQKVTGTVVDDKGEPLIGVQVVPVGNESAGVVTNFDGIYTINVPASSKKIQFSYMGFKAQTIAINGRSKIDVKMVEDSKQLEAVVVTAMGIKRKSKTLTYATQSISNKDLTRVQDANFVNALQGKTAGLTITPNSGGAGSASKILLRGNSSIQGNNSPLIVVDGIPMRNSVKSSTDGYAMAYGSVSEGSDALSSINPDDIANINVLKGANAAALYGSDAANGVIIITTKSGRDGVLKVDLSSNVTMETPLLLPEFQNKYGATIAGNSVSGNSWGKEITKANEELHLRDKAFNPRKFFNLGYTINNSVAISGGTKMAQSYFSISNTTAEGMIPGNKFQRNGITLRETFNFLNDKLKIDVSGNYVYQTNTNPISGGTGFNPLYTLYTAPRDLDIDYYRDNFEKEGSWDSNPITIYPEWSNNVLLAQLQPRQEFHTLKGMQQHWYAGRGVPGANNPYWLTQRINNQTITQKLYATLSVSYKINDIFDVVYRANIDRNQDKSEGKRYATTVDPGDGRYIDRGQYSNSNNHFTTFYTDALFNYHQTLFKDWSVASSAGFSFKRSTGENFWMLNNGAFNKDRYTDIKYVPTTINFFYPVAAYSPHRSFSLPSDWSRSVFATATLGWKEKVYLDGSYRIDWSRAFSQFSSKRNPFYGYFSIGANAILSELVSMPEWINLVKLRTSLSEVGNSIPNYNFESYNISISGAVAAREYDDFEDPKPETVRSFEAGFDFAALNNRLNIDFTYYNSTMFNQFLPITSSTGVKLPINSGRVRNQGIELTASYDFVFAKDLRWRTAFNYSYNTNKILSTYKGRSDISINIGTASEIKAIFKEGGAYGDLYGKDFARYASFDEEYGRTQNGVAVKEGDIRLTPDGAPLLDNVKGYSEYLGNFNAKHSLGWSNSLSYKDFDFYFLIDGKIGGKVISFTEAYLDAIGNSWRSGDARDNGEMITWNGKKVRAVQMPDGHYAPAQAYYAAIGSNRFASQYVYDATNLRLREMSFGYTFRSLLGNGKDLNLSLTARNLFFLYLNAPVDPDVSISTSNGLGGIDIFNMPTSRSVGLSFKVSF